MASIFSPRRTVLLRPRVQRLVDEALDELAGRIPPVDFHEAVSFPLPGADCKVCRWRGDGSAVTFHWKGAMPHEDLQ